MAASPTNRTYSRAVCSAISQRGKNFKKAIIKNLEESSIDSCEICGYLGYTHSSVPQLTSGDILPSLVGSAFAGPNAKYASRYIHIAT